MPAGAQAAEVSRCGELSDEALQQRIDYIEGELEAHEASIERWYFGYGSFYMVATTALTVRLNILDEDRDKQAAGVAIFGNILGLSNLLVLQPSLLTAREKLSTKPATDHEQRVAKLEFAESLYAKASKDVDRNTGWLSRLSAGLYTTASTLFVLFVIKDGWSALQQGIGGLIIGQSRAVLYPEGIQESYDSYREKNETCIADATPIRHHEPSNFSFEPNPTGFTVRF